MKKLGIGKWLKSIVIITGIMGLIFLFIIVPCLGKDLVTNNPKLYYMYLPCYIFIFITAIPFYIALFCGWNIFDEISKDNAFCIKNAKSLSLISKLAVSECILYIIASIALVILNLLHLEIFILIVFIIFIGLAIAILSGALSYLVEKASNIKEENDLTIWGGKYGYYS